MKPVIKTLNGMVDTYRGYFTMFPPALTAGLTVFLVAVYLIDKWFPRLGLFDSWILGSQALSSFEPNRLSFYPMAHLGFFHLLFNLFALVPLLARFERTHGTVHTGVVLNTVAVFPGIVYAAISWLFFPTNTVAGASGWVFTLLAFFTYKESYRMPAIFISETTSVATWLTPVIALFVTSVVMPNSSFLGHLLGILAGWALAMGRIDMMVEPPSNVIIKIESFLDKPISLIPKHFQFYREINAKELRIANRAASIPLTQGRHSENINDIGNAINIPDTSAQTEINPFQGTGQTLSNASS